MLEFISGVLCSESPVGFGVVFISVDLPCADFCGEGVLVGDSAVKALAGEVGEFGFGHVKPGAVFGGIMPLEPLADAEGFFGREGFI